VPLLTYCAPSGDLVNVHDPGEGNPLKVTLPVETVQVGGSICPTIGADRFKGDTGIVTSFDGGETQPAGFVVTEKP